MNVTNSTLENAIAFAVEKHKGVVRKGDGRPYILHPMSVLITLLAIKQSKNAFLLATAAILHDTVEDCDVTIEEIGKLFGWQVASLVDELTSDNDEIKKLGKTVYLARKMEKMSSYALCIKLVDRLDNIKDMKSMNVSFQKKQIDSTEVIIDHIEVHRTLSKTHKILIAFIKLEMSHYKFNETYIKQL